MYENIHKPRLLKDVPVGLIRPLPVIYYANKYANDQIPEHIVNLYKGSVEVLKKSLSFIDTHCHLKQFSELSEMLMKIDVLPSRQMIGPVEEFNLQLATYCSNCRDDLRKNSTALKDHFSRLFKSNIKAMQILLINNSNNQQNPSKVINILRDFCHYKPESLAPDTADILSTLLSCDFVIFYAISDPLIHQQVQSLKTYRKPGICLVQMAGDSAPDRESIRHGSQLMKTGVEVLFKMFTPLRLFTTIDKTYLAYHLKAE